jgi:hypothetical protein
VVRAALVGFFWAIMLGDSARAAERTLVIHALPSTPQEYVAIFGQLPTQRQMLLIGDALSDIAAIREVDLETIADNLPLVRQEDRLVIFAGHNENGFLHLGDGRRLNLAALDEDCAYLGIPCAFISCAAANFVARSPATQCNVTVSETPRYVKALAQEYEHSNELRVPPATLATDDQLPIVLGEEGEVRAVRTFDAALSAEHWQMRGQATIIRTEEALLDARRLARFKKGSLILIGVTSAYELGDLVDAHVRATDERKADALLEHLSPGGSGEEKPAQTDGPLRDLHYEPGSPRVRGSDPSAGTSTSSVSLDSTRVRSSILSVSLHTASRVRVLTSSDRFLSMSAISTALAVKWTFRSLAASSRSSIAVRVSVRRSSRARQKSRSPRIRGR